MTTIIALSGKIASGKTTAANFLCGHSLASLGLVRSGFKITPEGKLYVSDIMGNESLEGVFDPKRRTKDMRNFLRDHVDEYIKFYSFADSLKELAVNVLGLDEKLVFGSQKDKNTLCGLRWENCVGVVTPEQLKFTELEEFGYVSQNRISDKLVNQLGLIVHEPGEMTVREVLQYIGTDVFRRLVSDCWVKSILKKIEEDKPAIGCIDDLRFCSEANAVHEKGGYTIRLLRTTKEDTHESESDLDDYKHFSFLVDNREMTVVECNSSIHYILTQLNLIGE